MIFQKSITTPADVPETTKKETILGVAKGLIHRLEFYFPPGSSGLLNLQLFDGTYQVAPIGYGEGFKGDNVLLAYDEIYFKLNPPFQFIIKTWNTSTRFSHQVLVRICMVSKQIFMARFLPTYAVDYQIEAMKKMEEEQKALRKKILAEGISGMGLGGV